MCVGAETQLRTGDVGQSRRIAHAQQKIVEPHLAVGPDIVKPLRIEIRQPQCDIGMTVDTSSDSERQPTEQIGRKCGKI